LRVSKPAEAIGIFFSGQKNPQHAFFQKGNKAVSTDFWHVKDPYYGVEVAIVGKITGNFSPTVPPFAARISRVIVDVEAPGGESGNV
jgi:hypothetical protein